MKINANAKELIKKLAGNGYKAYIVGGCVRDALLHTEPHDWDICTSATPTEMLNVFKEYVVIPTGIKHGTITVMVGDEGFEITTFRVDGKYSDGRHPDNVNFTKDIEQDLARRDFTINAMAYNDAEGLIDPYHGAEDLDDKIIRAVGNPNDRFSEDALRIMRMMRFSAVLNFDIDSETKSASIELRKNLAHVSPERIRDELVKMLLAPTPAKNISENPEVFFEILPELKKCDGFLQYNPHHEYDVFNHILHVVNAAENDKYIRLAALFHDIAKPDMFFFDADGVGHFNGHETESAKQAEAIMRRLRFSNEDIKQVTDLIRLHMVTIAHTEPLKVRQARRMVNRIGYDTALRLLKLHIADYYGMGKVNLDEIHETERLIAILSETYTSQDKKKIVLAVDGNDIMAKFNIKPGMEVGRYLNKAMDAVVDGSVQNEKDKIIDYLSIIAM